MTKPQVVFFGSGPVAAKSLELLTESFEVEAVITKPRPPHHKGDVPVVDLTEKLALPLLEATNKQSLDELISKHHFESKVAILIDFGIIVSQAVIDTFPLGIINSHFSLLPELRGADPITFSILSGQKQTGISLMLLVKGMDEGPLLAHAVYDLPPTITTPELTSDLIELSAMMLKDVIPPYLDGKVALSTQEEIAELNHLSTIPSYSQKLAKEDGRIDWTKPAEQIEREIRAYAGWPKSYTRLGNIDVVVTEAHVLDQTLSPGDILVEDGELIIGTGSHCLSINSLIPAGKKEMPVQAFLNGYKDKLAP